MQAALTPAQRLDYVAPADRKPVVLPGGKALAVWPVVNVEQWLIGNPMPRQVLVAPAGLPLLPDVANWAWHEYGMRAGFWRLLDAFTRRGIRPTLSINGSVCAAYPRVAAAARDAGWEFMGHGFVQIPTHKVEDQAMMVTHTVRTIESFTGEKCVGWLGPGLTETLETPDLLAAAGIRYIADFVVDDLPCPLRTRSGTVWSMPYSLELNDIPMFMIQHHRAEEFVTRAAASADRLIAEAKSASSAKVMGLAVHPYITGVPHRITVLEAVLDDLCKRPDVVFMQGRDILDWYVGATGHA